MKEIEEIVNYIILATIEHRVVTDGWNSTDENVKLMKLFLDLDLSILGSDRPTYIDYCQRVRKEYEHVPDSMFLEGRIKVLKHLSGLTNEHLEIQDIDNLQK